MSYFGLVGLVLSCLVHVGIVIWLYIDRPPHHKVVPPVRAIPVIEVQLQALPSNSHAPSANRSASKPPPPAISKKQVSAKQLSVPPLDLPTHSVELNRLDKFLDAVKNSLSKKTTTDSAVSQTHETNEIARHTAYLIAETVRYWKRPPIARRDMEVLLVLNLSRAGDILNVSVERSSGHLDFDHSALTALHHVARFEHVKNIPDNLYHNHFKQLRMRFRPDDLEE